jgi:hypothetical protein
MQQLLGSLSRVRDERRPVILQNSDGFIVPFTNLDALFGFQLVMLINSYQNSLIGGRLNTNMQSIRAAIRTMPFNNDLLHSWAVENLLPIAFGH